MDVFILKFCCFSAQGPHWRSRCHVRSLNSMVLLFLYISFFLVSIFLAIWRLVPNSFLFGPCFLRGVLLKNNVVSFSFILI